MSTLNVIRVADAAFRILDADDSGGLDDQELGGTRGRFDLNHDGGVSRGELERGLRRMATRDPAWVDSFSDATDRTLETLRANGRAPAADEAATRRTADVLRVVAWTSFGLACAMPILGLVAGALLLAVLLMALLAALTVATAIASSVLSDAAPPYTLSSIANAVDEQRILLQQVPADLSREPARSTGPAAALAAPRTSGVSLARTLPFRDEAR